MVAARPALDGIRVLDFTHFIAGPYCTMILADLGAEVVKVEGPGGDTFRRFRPPVSADSGAPFIWVNRNKASVCIDLGSEDGRAVARTLIDRADVLAENYSTGVMQRHGLDYATVSKTNPRLVYCSLSAYGRDGPLAGRAGFDPVIQAETGFMSMNGYPDKDPVRTGPAITDISTGIMGATAVLGALMARERQGIGQHVEVAMYDTCVSMVGFHAMNYLVSGVDPSRFGNTSPDSAPMDMYHTADGPIYVACANDALFRRLVEKALRRPDLLERPEYADNATRVKHREQLAQDLNAVFATDSRESWAERLRAAGIPAGIPRTVEGAFKSAEMAARKLVTRIPHAVAGEVPNIASPLRLSATPVVPPVAAPAVGQHTVQVLRDLGGLTDERIASLAASGVIDTTKA
jgi:crotonobetainyl-CoA:carnitine CoA-transferase CaiB-like acyl-CoA transferase